MSEPVSAGNAHRSFGGLVIGRAPMCKNAKSTAFVVQPLKPRKTRRMKNSLCSYKSSLLCVFQAHSFCFTSGGLATVLHYLTIPPRWKVSTLDKTRVIVWIQDGVVEAYVAQRLRVHHLIIVRPHRRFLVTNSVEERGWSDWPESRFQEKTVSSRKRSYCSGMLSQPAYKGSFGWQLTPLSAAKQYETDFTISASNNVAHMFDHDCQ